MIPQEEYRNRHKLVVPAVHHTQSSASLIFRVDSSVYADINSRWLVLRLAWVDCATHPGNYDIQVLVPVRDSMSALMFMTNSEYGVPSEGVLTNVRSYPPNLQLSYEEMEDFFREFAVSYNKMTPLRGIESTVAAWEMLLFCSDSFIATQTSSKFRRSIAETIDPTIGIKDRYYACSDAASILSVEQPDLFDKYERLIHNHVGSNIPWLVRLMERTSDEPIA